MGKLIIGKNSSIVKDIAPYLVGCDYISHKDIPSHQNLDQYEAIFVFAWNMDCLEENINIIDSLPKPKVVFISTIAVLSLNVRKQFSKYPVNKKIVEQYVLDSGGAVIRLGVWNQVHLSQSVGDVAITEKLDLVNLINNCTFDKSSISMPVSIVKGQLGRGRGITARILNFISRRLPNIFIFQGPIQLALRSMGIKTYGYTGDASTFFSSSLMVGFGVLASRYSIRNNFDGKVIVSGRPDVVLNDNGFSNTRIGLSLIGLSKFWHGVSISNNDGEYRKKVPLFIGRKSPPRHHKKLHVERICDFKNYFELHCKNVKGRQEILYVNKLILAAGPLENVRLLGEMLNVNVKLSDHEISAIGFCSTDQAVKDGFVKKFGPFIFPGNSLIGLANDLHYLLDFRPFVPDKHTLIKSQKNIFYLDSTKGILIKLITQFSFARINEAIFNKFGIGIALEKMSIFCQILARDCISFSPPNNFIRKRLSKKQLTYLSAHLKKKYPSYLIDEGVKTVDAQHIAGGIQLCTNRLFIDLIESGRLVVLGSPTSYELSARHHTIDLINRS
jgi:hypothetical protein